MFDRFSKHINKSKKCVNCLGDKSIYEYIWTPSMSGNRSDVCRDCEAIEKHVNGFTTKDVVNMVCNKTNLNRSDLYKNPDLVKSYKLNLLIKKKLKQIKH